MRRGDPRHQTTASAAPRSGEETKRKWRWEKRYQEESKIWFGIMVNVWLFCLTCIYQVRLARFRLSPFKPR